MLLVKTFVAPAGDKGLGLFADEPIPKGSVWWKHDINFDKVLTEEELLDLPMVPYGIIKDRYAYLQRDGTWYLCVDDARFVNHSDNPNTDEVIDVDCSIFDIALKDIAIGEEITCDYRKLCGTCKDGLTFDNKE